MVTHVACAVVTHVACAGASRKRFAQALRAGTGALCAGASRDALRAHIRGGGLRALRSSRHNASRSRFTHCILHFAALLYIVSFTTRVVDVKLLTCEDFCCSNVWMCAGFVLRCVVSICAVRCC